MKRYAILLIIALCSFSARSQISSDSTKLPNSQIATLLQIGDDWKKLSEEVSLLNDRSIILSEKIFTRDSLIAAQKRTISGFESVIAGYQTSEQNLIQQRTNLESEIKALRKKAKWNNTKSFVVSTAVVVLGILYILK